MFLVNFFGAMGDISNMALYTTKQIYLIAASIYGFLLEIASFEIISRVSIQEMYMKVYAVLGILILLKLIISAISYFIDPDNLSNEKLGASQIIKRVVSVILMLSLCPFLFSTMYTLQNAIIQDNLIGRLFSTSGSQTKDVGVVVVSVPETVLDLDFLSWDILTDYDSKKMIMTPSKALANTVYSAFVTCEVDESKDENEKWKDVCEVTAKYPLLVSPDTMESADDVASFDVAVLPAMIFGFILISFLLVTCIDIALRGVKLGILQIIAPIAVVSYIDPKTEDKFKTWLKMLVKVYADLFIRIALIYLLTFVVGTLTI